MSYLLETLFILLEILLIVSHHVALVTSSAEAIQSVIPIHINAKALPIAEVSAFSNAAVLLINPSHHLA
jgi:hypothetical protein